MFVIIPDDVVVHGVSVCAEVPRGEIARLFRSEPEENRNPIDVAGVGSDGWRVAVLQEIVRQLRRSSHLAGTLQTQDDQVRYETLGLENEGGELKTTDETVPCPCVPVGRRVGKSGRAAARGRGDHTIPTQKALRYLRSAS